jgi:hypothetical protein
VSKASSKNYTEGALARSSPLFGRLVSVTGDEFPTERAFGDRYLSEYQPHEAQKQLATAMISNRFVTTVAGRRSGKTYGGGREFLKRIVRDFNRARARGEKWTPPATLSEESKPLLWYWCIAPTYALGIYQKREIFEILGGRDSPMILSYVASKNALWLRGGILIEFKSADNPLRLVGSGLNGLWADEAARIKESAWNDNLRPALSDRLGWALFTTTPLGKNWIYSDLWAVDREGFANVHFRTVDNTSLPHLVAEVEEARATLSRALFLRNYEASFDAFEGKIFEEFLDDETHIVKRLPSTIYRRFSGIDWGHSNPGSQIEIGLSLDGYLYATREDYERELPLAPPPDALQVDSWTNRFSNAQTKRGVSHGWADPSEPSNIVLCRQRKLDIRRADNSVNPGIDLLATLLKPVLRSDGSIRPTLYIHEDCENLRRELASYRWSSNGKPVKENDHAVDALRYGVYTEAKRNRLFVTDKIAKRFSFDAFDLAA